MSRIKNTPIVPAASTGFPVLTTRLADVEPLMRPKIGRRPISLEKPQVSAVAVATFGAKTIETAPLAENTAMPAAVPAAQPKRRILTLSFILLLLGMAIAMNFALMWLMDGKNSAPSAIAQKGAILLGAPSSPPVPASHPAGEAPPAPANALHADDMVEVIPYRRVVYDPALIEQLERQNPPAAGNNTHNQ